LGEESTGSRLVHARQTEEGAQAVTEDKKKFKQFLSEQVDLEEEDA
jgi:hypothetical protein